MQTDTSGSINGKILLESASFLSRGRYKIGVNGSHASLSLAYLIGLER